MGIASNFRKQLFKRRIPQIFGFYLAGSWTALEFTQWAVERYHLSTYWEEVLVLTLLLLLPVVLVSAWHHGAPGKQSWGKFEKIFIPLNLIIIPIILFNTYSLDNFNSSIDVDSNLALKLSTEKPSKAEQAQQIISIAFFPFTNISKNLELDNLALISSEILDRDISQNNHFYSMNALTHMLSDLLKSEVDISAVPVSLQVNLAKKKNSKYFTNGTLNFSNNQYIISLKLHSSLSGKIISEFSVRNIEYFAAIDALTEELQAYLLKDFSDIQTDLPIGDLYTNNEKAFKLYVQARILLTQFSKHEEAFLLLERAVLIDPTFAYANLTLARIYAPLGKITKAQQHIANTIKYRNIRFTKKELFNLNMMELSLNQQIEKVFGVLEQWIEYYPSDWKPLQAQIRFATILGKHQLAIQASERLLELIPSRISLWGSIGDSYLSLADYDKALFSYKKYISLNPKEKDPYSRMGNYYSVIGNFDSAITYYQRALNLDPQHISTKLKIANIYARLGKFNESQEQYKSAIDYAQLPTEKNQVTLSLADLYWRFGQRGNAITTYLNTFKDFSKITTIETLHRVKTQYAKRFYTAGKKKYAWAIINDALDYAEESQETILGLDTSLTKSLLLNLEGKALESITLVNDTAKQLKIHVHNFANEELDYVLGQAHMSNGNYHKSIELFVPINKKHPKNIAFMSHLAEAYYLNKDYQNSKNIYDSLLKIAPGYPSHNLGMAKVMIKERDHDLAKVALNKAIKGWSVAEQDYPKLLEAKLLLKELEQ